MAKYECRYDDVSFCYHTYPESKIRLTLKVEGQTVDMTEHQLYKLKQILNNIPDLYTKNES